MNMHPEVVAGEHLGQASLTKLPFIPVTQRRDGPPWISELLICAAGSSAVAILPNLLEILMRRNIAGTINLILTDNARKFVAEAELRALPRTRLIGALSATMAKAERSHTEIAKASAVGVVVPATANLVGKLANGIVDDDATTILSVYDRPLVVFPAVHPITAKKRYFLRNIDQLKKDGNVVVGPVKGYSMTDGIYYDAVGAMPDPEKIAVFLECAAMCGIDSLRDIIMD